MKIFLIAILLSALIFTIIDIIWLSYSVKNFYRPNLGQLLNDKPVIWAAILFYFLDLLYNFPHYVYMKIYHNDYLLYNNVHRL